MNRLRQRLGSARERLFAFLVALGEVHLGRHGVDVAPDRNTGFGWNSKRR